MNRMTTFLERWFLLFFLAAMACVAMLVAGCAKQQEQAGIAKPIASHKISLVEDFVLGSETAVSNATFFGAPPEGFGVSCDMQGHYIPRTGNGPLNLEASAHFLMRTSYWEAVVACWRVKEVWDSSHDTAGHALPVLTNVWINCDK